jgi:hypothetical protein
VATAQSRADSPIAHRYGWCRLPPLAYRSAPHTASVAISTHSPGGAEDSRTARSGTSCQPESQPMTVRQAVPGVGVSGLGGGIRGPGSLPSAGERRRRPIWLRVISGVCHELRQMPADRPVALVPHSNLGLERLRSCTSRRPAATEPFFGRCASSHTGDHVGVHIGGSRTCLAGGLRYVRWSGRQTARAAGQPSIAAFAVAWRCAWCRAR